MDANIRDRESVILGADGKPLKLKPQAVQAEEPDEMEIRPVDMPVRPAAPEPEVASARREEADSAAIDPHDEHEPLEATAVSREFLRDRHAFPETLQDGRFVSKGAGEYRRKGEEATALKMTGSSIKFLDKKADAIAAGVELAKLKGWTAIEVKGSRRHKQALWLAASLEGIQVLGFEPKEADLKMLEAARTGRDFRGEMPTVPAEEKALEDAMLKSGRSVIKANYQDADYSGPVLGANASHVAIEFNGREGHTVVLERERLGEVGRQAEVGQMLSVALRDGQSQVKRLDTGRERGGMER